jgi:hypothetical protein
LRERFSLGDVGRHEVGAREQLVAQHRDGVGLEQRIAVLAEHHRVDDDEERGAPREAARDGADDRRVAEGAGLDGADAQVVEDRFDLRDHERGVERLNGGHAAGVLHGDQRDRRGAVDPVLVKGLQVRLHARSPRRVRASDRERHRSG